MTVAFDPLLALRTLVAHEVRFVVIGGVAGALWGSPSITMDVDICYERGYENHEALAAALRELGATLRGAPPGLPFQLDARTIKMGDSFTFDTLAGSVDCLGTPSGTDGYADLRRNAAQFDLEPDLRVDVCSLDDLMRMKRAAGRPKDRAEVEILAALSEERQS
ncbi:MAG TPA: hypothetical protein VHL58_04055 [Thermoanaerobaculia bacterium]|nr:hypothetical protein [Thermoanaerobaculia bacterium]